MPRSRSIQTKLKSSTQDDNAWKTIGRPKKREQASEASQDRNFKKADSKNTPPRDALTKTLQLDPLTAPIPSSPNSSMDDSTNTEGNFLLAIKGTTNKPAKFTTSQPPSMELSNDEISKAEYELIAAINAINSSKTFVSHTKSNTTSDIGEEKREISLVSATASEGGSPSVDVRKTPDTKEDNNFQIDIHQSSEPMDVTEEFSTSFFTQHFPRIYPPDWTLSPANNFQLPNPDQTDAIDSSLVIENERHLSLCLAPFSKEFYTITGHSKLNIPEDYQELI
jgi:hypothetical protein